MPIYSTSDATITNSATIEEDVTLEASGIRFVNSELGRVLGQFVFRTGGSTLVNEAGGYVGAPAGADPWTFRAVIGSDGNDTIIDHGTIAGLIALGAGDDLLVSNSASSTYATTVFGADLGSGDDTLRFEGSSAPFFVYGNGGDGVDTFEFAATTNQVYGTHLTGFEILSLQATGNYCEFSGYEQIVAAPGLTGGFLNLVDSDNPLAHVALVGSRWSFHNSVVGSLTGDDGDDTVWVSGSTEVLGTVSLGDGADTVVIGGNARAATLADTLDGGGGGFDILAYEVAASFSDTLANVTGFERMTLTNYGADAGTIVTLQDVSGFSSIYAEANIGMAISTGGLAGTTLGGAIGASIDIAAGITVAAYSYGAPGWPINTSLTNPTFGNSTTLTNNGTIVGSVIFYDGDDLYDGTAGSAGLVHGNAGNDRLWGGSEAEEFHGDAGADTLLGNGGADALFGGDGSDTIDGGSGDDLLDGGDGADLLTGNLGNDLIEGGGNVDTAILSGNRADYTISQTATGVFEVAGADGTDTLTDVEFLQFDDETIRLLPGTGVSVNFETADPSVYQDALGALRDFDGNALGGDGSWLRIGSADIDGDGDIDQILVNREIGRFATVGGTEDGLYYFSDYSWAGETRVVGIYVDPLVASGDVAAGGPDDSQRRFQNDLQIENINRVLGADDYDGDGLQEVYFALTDGTAYLHAYMHADGNIRYANYQSQQQVIDFLTENGFDSSTWADWFPSTAEPDPGKAFAAPGETADTFLAGDFGGNLISGIEPLIVENIL